VDESDRLIDRLSIVRHGGREAMALIYTSIEAPIRKTAITSLDTHILFIRRIKMGGRNRAFVCQHRDNRGDSIAISGTREAREYVYVEQQSRWSGEAKRRKARVYQRGKRSLKDH